MRFALVFVLLLTAALAGCADKGSDAQGGGTGTTTGHGAHGQHDPDSHLLAPTWQLGQWWALASEQSDAPFTHVVSGEDGDDWIVDTDSPDLAFFDARSDISFLGKVRKADLAGSQASERIEFFQFPLTPGKNWTTRWDQMDVGIHVKSVAAGKAQLEARHANGTLFATFTYDDGLGYFRDYAFYAPDGTTVGFAARVTGNGLGFTGDLVRWGLETLYEAEGAVEGPAARNFDVDPGYTDVWASVDFGCTGPGTFGITFGPVTGPAEERGYSANGPCPQQLAETLTISTTSEQEFWGVASSVSPGTPATLDLVLLARTQVLFKAGAAP